MKVGINIFFEAENYTTEEPSIELLNDYKKRIEEVAAEIKDTFYYKGTSLSISIVKPKSFSDENIKNRTYAYAYELDSLLRSPKYPILTMDFSLYDDINDKENLFWYTSTDCFKYKEIEKGLYVTYNKEMSDANLLELNKLDYSYPIYIKKGNKSTKIKIKEIHKFIDNKVYGADIIIKIDKNKFLNGILLNKNIRFGYLRTGVDNDEVVDLTENYIDLHGATDDNYIYIETFSRELELVVFELD